MSKKKQCRKRKPNPVATKPQRDERPVPRHEQQAVAIGDMLLDVEAAFRLLRAKPRRTVRIDVAGWARLYGLDGNPYSPVHVGRLFDPAHAMTTDLRRPLILVTLSTDDGDEVELIADGSHRLYRGYSEGRDSLPAYILTAAETLAITLTPSIQKDQSPP